MKHASKVVLTLAAILAALTLAACGSSDDNGDKTVENNATTSPSKSTTKGAGAESKKPGVPTIVIRGGEPVGGVRELEYDAGDRIRFQVESDVADEVHVHGYDLLEQVPAGGEVSFDFTAEIEGIFEVELEERAEQIAELRVNP